MLKDAAVAGAKKQKNNNKFSENVLYMFSVFPLTFLAPKKEKRIYLETEKRAVGLIRWVCE